MAEQPQVLRLRCFRVLLLFLVFFTVQPVVAGERFPKEFTAKQAQRLARRLVADLAKDPFFHEDPLGRRVALSVLPVTLSETQVKSHDFTNLILSEFLDSFQVSVVNQDPALNGSRLDYSLISYDDHWTTRKRGLLMGAEYVVGGELASFPDSDKKGKPFLNVRAELRVHEIRTDALVLKREVFYKKRGHH